jgi:hypothetical protein
MVTYLLLLVIALGSAYLFKLLPVLLLAALAGILWLIEIKGWAAVRRGE